MSRKKLGKYEIIDRIGRGGMAEVYRGYHVALDRYVAIKLLHPFLADDLEFKDRFENEARNVAKLKHPNIVQVYDFEYDVEGDSYYMVMEMINGPTLKDRIFDLSATGTRFSVSEAIRISRNAAEALAYAHQRSMIHRDVKPANLMLDEDGRVVLTDFGIAKIVTGAQFTASGGMIGTPAYMAPEQGLGEPGDERSDLYSLGVIMFQMLTDHLPFDAETPLAIILKHVNDPIPSLGEFIPDVPADLEDIVHKTLAKEPEDRYQTAYDLVDDLAALDENGKRRAIFDTQQVFVPPAPVRKPDSQPSPPPLRDHILASGYIPPVSATTRAESVSVTPSPASRPAPSGRMNPIGVLGTLATVLLLAVIGLALFGRNGNPLASLLSAETDLETPIPSPTLGIAAALTSTPTIEPTQLATIPARMSPTPLSTRAVSDNPATQTSDPTATTTPTSSPTATMTQTPSPTTTSTMTPSPTPSLTRTPTATLTPTVTPQPTATFTPTPNMTGTAAWLFLEQQARATPTPNMTQTLVACDFEFIVVEPGKFNVPPAVTDVRNPRLVRAGDEFEMQIILRNTGTCDWPEGTRLSFNEVLTVAPDRTVNLDPMREACPNSVPVGVNFATQQQSNFFLGNKRTGITQDSDPVLFTGTAPNTLGCYYGVWDLLYPNSDVTIGRPLLLTIRAWGGG